jgi:NAD(P)-dependent dehydrogenase (short-subunit alcohol dehydrogenase family)
VTGVLEGKTVRVSGVGDGLGMRLAASAMREGANVVLVARSKDKLEEIAGRLEGDGTAVAQQADITDEEQCRAAVATAVDRFGHLDGVVNCAAFEYAFGGLEASTWDEWQQAISVNILGVMKIAKAALAPLRDAGGAIVFIGSQTNYHPPSEVLQLVYASTKSAQVGAMRHMALEMGPSGVRVNLVVPGWMWGPPVEGFVNATAEGEGVPVEEVLTRLTKDMPLRRMATDAEVAEAATFLLSPRASGITGQTLFVNAGEYMN